MRTATTISLVVLFAACCASTRAQECADWSRFAPDPHVEPAITGNVCRLHRGMAYVAESEFIAVDVSQWDRPLVTGRVVLPAVAQDLTVAWPRAWAACGEAGIVELDISDPAAPLVARVYDPARAVTKVVEIDGAVIGLDADSNLHFLAVEDDGRLDARAVHAWSEPVMGMAKVSGHLVVGSTTRISVVDLRNVNTLSVTSDISHGWWPAVFTITADRDRVVFARMSIDLCDMVTQYTTELTSYVVSATGGISRLGCKRNLPNATLVMAASSGGLVQTSNYQSTWQVPVATIRDIDDLDVKARLPFGGRSLDWGEHLLIAVGAAGLTTVALPSATSLPAAIDVRGDLDTILGPGFDSTTYSAWWTPSLGLLTTSDFQGICGGAYGRMRRTVSYTLVDGHDPASWREVASGSFSDSQGRDSGCSLSGLAMEEIPGGRSVLIWGNDCTQRVIIVDVNQRHTLGGLVEHRSDTPVSVYTTGRILWVEGASGTRCFDVTALDPLAPINTVQLIRSGLRLVADEQLLVVYIATTNEFDTYDMTNVNDVRHLATWTGPSGYLLHQAWLGRRFAYVTHTALHVVDFSNPAAPVLLSTTTLPRYPLDMAAYGSRLVLRYPWVTGSPTTSPVQFQAADIASDGSVILHAAWDAWTRIRDHIVSGDVLYADDGYGIRAYDLRDPDEPALIGTALSGSGSFAIVGNYLGSGSILTPRDCRDLTQPHMITIDVQPVVKPGSWPGYEGPALVPVIVRAAPDFDPATLDPSTVRFGPDAAAPVSGPAEKPQRPTIIGNPGATGSLFWFRLDKSGITSVTDEVRLTGRTFAGEDVLGIAWLNIPSTGPTVDGPALAASPNPFNPRTTLSFTMAAGGPAQLVVYNLQGQRVRLLVDGAQTPGRQSIIWDGTDDAGLAVASGVYFARLTGGGKIETQRLALVR